MGRGAYKLVMLLYATQMPPSSLGSVPWRVLLERFLCCRPVAANGGGRAQRSAFEGRYGGEFKPSERARAQNAEIIAVRKPQRYFPYEAVIARVKGLEFLDLLVVSAPFFRDAAGKKVGVQRQVLHLTHVSIRARWDRP